MNNIENLWEIVPFAIISIAVFTFIMMIALISNTTNTEKTIKELRDMIEDEIDKRTNQTLESDR